MNYRITDELTNTAITINISIADAGDAEAILERAKGDLANDIVEREMSNEGKGSYAYAGLVRLAFATYDEYAFEEQQRSDAVYSRLKVEKIH